MQKDRLANQGRRRFLVRAAAGGAVAGLVWNTPLAKLLAAVVTESEQEAPGPAYGFIVNIDRCIGCGKCVEACSIENNVPEGYVRTWVERYVVTDKGVHVDSPRGAIDGFEGLDDEIKRDARQAFFVPKLCNHCLEAPCIQVCPVGATFHAPGGFVLVDPEHCIGCGYCIQACPYGARFKNPETHVADKCTWCYHRVSRGGLPACVEVCPTQARLFGDVRDQTSDIGKIYTYGNWSHLKPEMHTEGMCMYLGLPREVV
ncbi:MAG: 4Fe-4S dicluster domain-containing protein [Pseudomonadota bacterium]|nr:4Fe-4S dicluster domain-containing protein [Pseudomonadota bacterium]